MHPKSFVSNFWGAVQTIFVSAFLLLYDAFCVGQIWFTFLFTLQIYSYFLQHATPILPIMEQNAIFLA